MSHDADVEGSVHEICRRARRAARQLAGVHGAAKNEALRLAAERLRADASRLLDANGRDVSAAGAASAAFLDRLTLNPERIEAMADGIDQIAAPSRSGRRDRSPRGAGRTASRSQQVRVPIGVVGIIYESRPNVTADAAALCLKSGNATILKGGSEALHTNAAIADVIRDAVADAGLPAAAVQLDSHHRPRRRRARCCDRRSSSTSSCRAAARS